MAQPPDFGYDQLKKMIRARDFRIANLQSKNDKLKGDIPATATSSLRAPIELPESFQRAFSS